MVDIQKYESEIRSLKDENEKLRGELKQERLRNLKNPISAIGRIIKDLNDVFYNGRSYELQELLSSVRASDISIEDNRAAVILRNLLHYSIGQWIFSLKKRWDWLDENPQPNNEFLIQLANETIKVVNSYYHFLVESKKIFDKYDEFKKENGNDLKKMYDIYSRIVNGMELFIKTYGEIYNIESMRLKRIVFE